MSAGCYRNVGLDPNMQGRARRFRLRTAMQKRPPRRTLRLLSTQPSTAVPSPGSKTPSRPLNLVFRRKLLYLAAANPHAIDILEKLVDHLLSEPNQNVIKSEELLANAPND